MMRILGKLYIVMHIHNFIFLFVLLKTISYVAALMP